MGTELYRVEESQILIRLLLPAEPEGLSGFLHRPRPDVSGVVT